MENREQVENVENVSLEETRRKRAEYHREWRKRNPEKVRTYVKSYREKYPDKIRSFGRKYYHENRDEILEKQKEERRTKTETVQRTCVECGAKVERLSPDSNRYPKRCPECRRVHRSKYQVQWQRKRKQGTGVKKG